MKEEPVNVKLPAAYHDMICEMCREFESFYKENEEELGRYSFEINLAADRIEHNIHSHSDTSQIPQGDILYLLDAIRTLVEYELINEDNIKELTIFLKNAVGQK